MALPQVSQRLVDPSYAGLRRARYNRQQVLDALSDPSTDALTLRVRKSDKGPVLIAFKDGVGWEIPASPGQSVRFVPVKLAATPQEVDAQFQKDSFDLHPHTVTVLPTPLNTRRYDVSDSFQTIQGVRRTDPDVVGPRLGDDTELSTPPLLLQPLWTGQLADENGSYIALVGEAQRIGWPPDNLGYQLLVESRGGMVPVHGDGGHTSPEGIKLHTAQGQLLVPANGEEDTLFIPRGGMASYPVEELGRRHPMAVAINEAVTQHNLNQEPVPAIDLNAAPRAF